MLAYLFIALAVAFRFIPHPMAFTPVAAALLFFGARQPMKRAWIPLLLLAGTDVILTKYVYAYAFTADHVVSWVYYAAVIGFGGFFLRDKAKPLRLVGASLTASVTFFLASNLAVWAAYPGMYPKTLGGIWMSYVAGLPFFRNEVAGDLFFTAVFFAVPVALHALGHAKEQTGTA
jgi:hypothetical protein